MKFGVGGEAADLSWEMRERIMEPSFSSLVRVSRWDVIGKAREDGQDGSIIRVGIFWCPVVLGVASRLA